MTEEFKNKKHLLSELSRQLKTDYLAELEIKGLNPEEHPKKVNDLLKEFYEAKDYQGEILEWNSYKQWVGKEKQVKKGSKGFMFWTKPMKGKDKDLMVRVNGEEKPSEYDFFSICYLFNSKQTN